jgi:hypothetical protein
VDTGCYYRQGYTGFDYHVTGGHEAEAEVAERGKKPGRLGLRVLKLLGFRGSVEAPLDVRRTSRGASSITTRSRPRSGSRRSK